MPIAVKDNITAPEGLYQVKFGGFQTRDAAGEPVAKSTDYGLKVFLKLVIQDGKLAGETLPCSADLEQQLANWCFVFSGKPPQSMSLSDVEKQMVTAKVVTVRVGEKGWVNGVHVPKATYLARFSQFSKRNEDGKPVPADKEFKGEKVKVVYWGFEVAGGDLAGVVVPGSCRYSIRNGSSGLELASRSSFYNWLSSCGVEFDSVPDFLDPDNCLPEFEEIMQRANALVTIMVGENGWVEGGQNSVAPAPAGVVVAPPKAETPKASSEPARAADSKGLADLMKVIDDKAKELEYGSAFDDGQLNAAGKKFATEHIAPFCAAQGIPRSFAKMTPENIGAIVAHLNGLKKADEF